MVLEICVDSLESAKAADIGGCDRLEVCSNISVGGTTPSAGLIETIRQQISLELSILIRPRSGDFVYTDTEFKVLQHDIAQARKLGADSVAFGLLDVHGDVDFERTCILAESAHPLKTTFHRAFDMTRDLSASLDTLIRAGIDRVLTSGGEVSATDGTPVIRKLREQAGGRMVVMPAGGITTTNIVEVAGKTGAVEFHAGLRTRVPSRVRSQRPPLFLGRHPYGSESYQQEYSRFVVLEEDVRMLRQQLDAFEAKYQL